MVVGRVGLGSRDGYRLFMTYWCVLGKDGWMEGLAGFIGCLWIGRLDLWDEVQ